MIDSIQNQVNTFMPQPQGSSAMDKDSFLKLMISQLQNQDPLKPMDGTQYASQLAQFTSVEQLSNLNKSMDKSIDANYYLTQSINNTLTATLIGNNVKLASPVLSNIGQDNINFGYNLPDYASSLTVKIYNENGALVRTISDAPNTFGDNKLSWDFFDDNGNKLPEGKYTFEVNATDLRDEDMQVETYGVGTIDGVRFGEDGTNLLVGGIQYNIADVIEILNNNLAGGG